MRTGGIVLCGGKSSRMGWPKVTLPFGAESLLERVLRRLGEAVQPLVVVASPEQQLPALPANVGIVRDEREGRGPLEGLCAGLSAMHGRATAAFASGCDAPLLSPDFVRRMVESLGPHDIAVPVDGSLYHPLAAVYRVSVLPHIRRLLAADRLRPAFLFEETDTRKVPVETLRSVDPELHSLANLNYPRDYLRALADAGLEAPPEVLRRWRPTTAPEG
jgi:molybdopterin-guanine dinucleotide biosynthesis protein A